jgi:hypothetical protein
MTLTDSNPLYVELPKGPYHSYKFIRNVSDIDFKTLRGFRSVYLYGQEAYNQIIEQQAVRNLSQFPVYSDTLFVDFDDGENSKDQFAKILETSGHGYDMYFSGKKGYHFHVPIEPMWGASVPYSQKMWVSSLGIESVDTSIYRHTGLFRLPGTIHQSTGKKKELIKSFEGRKVEIPIIDLANEAKLYGVESDNLAIAKACHTILRTAAVGAQPGQRHNTLLSIAKSLTAAGMNEGTCVDICSAVNEFFDEPKSQEEVHECVRRAVNWQINGSSPSTQPQEVPV